MKFRFISAHRETFKVGRMCALSAGSGVLDRNPHF